MAHYRVLAGKHHVGTGVNRKVFKAGDIVTTDSDLMQFNQPGAAKFEVVDSVGRPKTNKPVEKRIQSKATVPDIPLGDGLGDMTVNELRAMAEEEEIDLGSASRKDEIVKAIRNSMVSTAAEEGFAS